MSATARSLALTDLDEPCPRAKQPGKLRQESAIDLQAIGTAVQRPARLPPPHLRLQPLELGRRKVGRIAHDQVERTAHAAHQIGPDQEDTVGDPQATALRQAQAQGGGGEVGRHRQARG